MNTLDLLVAQFPGRAYISMTAAGQAIGYKTQTCYNLFHQGIFPLPVKKVGVKCMVSLTDLAKFMNTEAANDTIVEPIVAKVTRKSGRPSKAEMIARRLA